MNNIRYKKMDLCTRVCLGSDNKLETQIYKYAFKILLECGVSNKRELNELEFDMLAFAIRAIQDNNDYDKTKSSQKELEYLIKSVMEIERSEGKIKILLPRSIM